MSYGEMSYGEIGYEAYRAKSGGKSLVSGQDIPPWKDLSNAIKEAWEAAGEAVRAEVRSFDRALDD